MNDRTFLILTSKTASRANAFGRRPKGHHRLIETMRCVFAVALMALVLVSGLAGSVASQGFAGLGTQSDDFAAVRPDTPLEFPRDHAAHPDYRIEWWYLTANLRDESGAPLGIQWTLFRSALAPGPQSPGWQNQQLWMGHAAITSQQTHRFAERLARGGVGQAGVSMGPFEAFIDNWYMRSTAGPGEDPLSRLDLTASKQGDFSYRLALVADGPLVLHGQDGFSQKAASGQASHYYSQPFYRVSGTVEIDGIARKVVGQAWLDREWSSQPLSEDQYGWDWMSVHFDGGSKLMAFQLRQSDGDNYTSGTWIEPDGSTRALGPGDLEFAALDHFRTEAGDVPVTWQVTLPRLGKSFTLSAINAESFMNTLFAYWEGPAVVSGDLSGIGYLEMTGYAQNEE